MVLRKNVWNTYRVEVRVDGDRTHQVRFNGGLWECRWVRAVVRGQCSIGPTSWLPTSQGEAAFRKAQELHRLPDHG